MRAHRSERRVVDAEDHVPERDRLEAQPRRHPRDERCDRAPGDLERPADAARGAAQRELRSVNAQIEFLLREGLARRGHRPRDPGAGDDPLPRSET